MYRLFDVQRRCEPLLEPSPRKLRSAIANEIERRVVSTLAQAPVSGVCIPGFALNRRKRPVVDRIPFVPIIPGALVRRAVRGLGCFKFALSEEALPDDGMRT